MKPLRGTSPVAYLVVSHTLPHQVQRLMSLLRRAAISTIATVIVWLLCCGALGVLMVEGALHPARNRITQSEIDTADP